MNKIRAYLFHAVHQIMYFICYGDLPTWYYKKRGMKIGVDFNRQSETKFDPTHCYLIEIGDHVGIANHVQILAHDHAPSFYAGYYKIGKVVIGNHVYIGAGALILPDVVIGDNALIAAGSVVTKDVRANCVVAGVPAREISSMEEYQEKCSSRIAERPVLENIYVYGKKMPKQKKEEIKKACKEGARYFRSS